MVLAAEEELEGVLGEPTAQGGSSASTPTKAPASNIDIACRDYEYPWCEDAAAKEDIAGLVKRFYDYALALVGVAALGAIIYGGILYTVSEAAGTKQEAIGWITGAVWGLVLLLGANLLLRTINPKLTQLELTELKKVEVKVDTKTPSAIGGLAGASWPLGASPTGTYSDDFVRTELAKKSITINNANCVHVGQKNCTSLDGLPQSTLNHLIELQKEAKEPFVITGGTEYWLHKTHGPGKPVIDIRYKETLLNDIQKMSKDGNIASYQCEIMGRQPPAVNCNESQGKPSHFHIVFK